MTFARVKTGGWAVNEKLTSAQMNALDIDHSVSVADAYLASAPVLSWRPRTTLPQIFRRSTFNSFESRVYACADNAADRLYYSINYGNDWVSAGTATTFNFFDITSNANGDMVIVTSGGRIVDYTRATTTYTDRGAVLAGTPSGATVMWSPSASLWSCVYRNAALGLQAYTSPDRITWTSRTAGLPATLTGYAGTNNPQASVDASGNIVVLLNTGTATDYKGAKSTDGGITWTAFTIATTVNASVSRPVWSAYDSAWMVSAYGGTPTATAVFTSPDGLTWTSVYTNATLNFQQLAVVDRLYAALGNDGRLYYSTSPLATMTWRRADVGPFGGTAWLWAMSGGLMYWEEGALQFTASNVRLGATGVSV